MQTPSFGIALGYLININDIKSFKEFKKYIKKTIKMTNKIISHIKLFGLVSHFIRSLVIDMLDNLIPLMVFLTSKPFTLLNP